jgi:quercetin dioxygenase-like cupin family protein
MDGEIRIVDNVFVKMIPLTSKGDTTYGHAHTYDHITLLSVGRVLMKHDNGQREFTAPCLIVTPKGIAHEFVSLADFSLLCCIHALRDEAGEILLPETDPSVAANYTQYLTIKG